MKKLTREEMKNTAGGFPPPGGSIRQCLFGCNEEYGTCIANAGPYPNVEDLNICQNNYNACTDCCVNCG